MTWSIRLGLVAMISLMLPGCSEVNYERTEPGKLKGKLILEWVDQDKFRFISDATDPLRFVRANSQEIQPGPMFTDGGSIPAPLRAIKSFSPWGYAPAFIIHDWLFVMKQCRLPGYENWDHLKAAEVFSEVMKTVMENPKFGGPNKLVHYSMYEAVRSDIARQYWDDGKCETPDGTMRSLGPTRSLAPRLDDKSGKTRGLTPPPSAPGTRSLSQPSSSPSTRMRTVVQF